MTENIKVPFGVKEVTETEFSETLEVTLDGRTFLMDSFMRNLAAGTLVSLEGSGVTSVQWKLSDGSIDSVLLTDLKEVLRIATVQIRDFWAA